MRRPRITTASGDPARAREGAGRLSGGDLGMAYDNHMARRAGLRLASRFSPLLPGVAQGLRIVVPTCAAARRPAAPRRVRGEPAPTHHSRLPVAIQLSGGKVRLVGTRVAPDDARDSPQVGQPPLPGGCTVARRRVVERRRGDRAQVSLPDRSLRLRIFLDSPDASPAHPRSRPVPSSDRSASTAELFRDQS